MRDLRLRIAHLRRTIALETARLHAQLDIREAAVRQVATSQRRSAAGSNGVTRLALVDDPVADALATALRRHLGGRAERHVRAAADGRLIVDSDRLTADVDGRRRKPLTPTEWQLLNALLANPGVVLSREELAARAWGPGYRTRGSEVEVYISRLRRKLGDARRGGMIETVRGRGYCFIAERAGEPM